MSQSGEEDDAAGEDARQGGAAPGRPVDRFLDEIEGNGADQHAGAKTHDQPDRAYVDPDQEGDDRADHERGRRQRSPTERSRHRLPIMHWPRDWPNHPDRMMKRHALRATLAASDVGGKHDRCCCRLSLPRCALDDPRLLSLDVVDCPAAFGDRPNMPSNCA
jgi:hypothetical protein